MSFISYLLLCISVFATTATAQEKCNCSPFEYTFQLNLHPSNPNFAECPWPPSLGPGVEWYNCIDDLEDIKHNIAGGPGIQPVKITEAHFLSQDEDGNILDQQFQYSLDLRDGDTLTFVSPLIHYPVVKKVTLHIDYAIVPDDSVNGSFTMNIQFTNECGVLPLQEGTNFGFVTFVSLLFVFRLCTNFVFLCLIK